LLDAAGQWANLPLDWRRLLAQQLPGLDKVLDFGAPVDVVVALPPRSERRREPLKVISIGLTSVDAALDLARSKKQEVNEIRPGVYQVGPGQEAYCIVAPALGRARARLICSDESVAVEMLYPYATRGLPNENLATSDVFFELRADAIRARYGGQLRNLRMLRPFVMRELALDSPRFDRALGDAIHAVLDEGVALAEDVKRVRLDAILDNKAQSIDAQLRVEFSGKKSWLVQTLSESGAAAAVAPDAFWRLPGDATAASYYVAIRRERIEPVVTTLSELLDGVLDHVKAPRARRDQTLQAFTTLATLQGIAVSAQGPLDRTTVGKPATLSDVVRTGAGWYVLGLEDEPARQKNVLPQLAQLIENKGLRQLVEKRAKLAGAKLPSARVRPAKGLGAGANELELTIPPELVARIAEDGRSELKPGGAVVFYVVSMPEAKRVWYGISGDKDLIYKRLAALRDGKAPTLATREGLAPLKGIKAMYGGFFSLGEVARELDELVSIERAQSIDRAVNAAPHGGTTPILGWLRVTPAQSGTTAVFELRAPKPVFEDVAAVMMGL
jgi:hypothetical protein